MILTRRRLAAVLAAGAPLVAAGCSREPVDADAAREAHGPITIWVSSNEQELAWGKAVTEAWNAEHPDEPVTCQEVPAGTSSEEAVTAAIVAGTSPDLVFNCSPAALPDWVRQGGLVDLATFDGGAEHIESRNGPTAELYADGDQYYQLPWKANPVMVMYNRDLFAAAGIDPDSPGMDTYDSFLEGARAIVQSGAAGVAMWPDPSSTFYQSWFDYYPLYLAQTGGTMLVDDGRATFDSDDGRAVAEFWHTIYGEGLAPREKSTDDAMTTGAAAMATTGPYAIATYKDTIDYGFMPVPTQTGTAPSETFTFSDAKTVAMFSSSVNRATAWEFLTYATSEENDGRLLDLSGQMPMRQNLIEVYPDYFTDNPDYVDFADQASRVGEVPYVSGGIEIWQRFRDTFSGSVILDKQPVDVALADLAQQIDRLLQEG
jgi:multiple sugar transport system substrate-binding protein